MQKEKYLFMECVHFWRQCNGCYLSTDSLLMFMLQSNAVYIIFCALFKNLRWCMVKRLHSCHHEMLLLCSFYSFFYHLFSICKHKIDFMIDNITLKQILNTHCQLHFLNIMYKLMRINYLFIIDVHIRNSV